MPANSLPHPSDDMLRAVHSGNLDNATAGAIFAHLDTCPECLARAASLSGGSFPKRVRAAHARSATPAPSQPLPGVARSTMSPGVAPRAAPVAAAIPPELCDHPQYEVLEELGRGGMGVVYLAKNKKMGRFEVLKVVNKDLLDQPDMAERFKREMRSAAQLSHSNIVTAYAAPEAGELLVFAMEYVKGEDLGKVVTKRGKLPVVNACYYVQQAALGLQHAHEKGMVHRDIKPGNLILAVEGKKHVVKILDFGLAKMRREKEVTSLELREADQSLTQYGAMMGTPAYVAPEQILNAARADIPADIYSLGCTLYFLLAGRPPFQGESLDDLLGAHHSAEAKPLNEVREEVSAELAAVVATMMAKDPARRYQKPVEVAQALAQFAKRGLKPLPAVPPPGVPAPEPAAAKPVAIPVTVIEGQDTIARSKKRHDDDETVAPAPAISPTMIEDKSTAARAIQNREVAAPSGTVISWTKALRWRSLLLPGVGVSVTHLLRLRQHPLRRSLGLLGVGVIVALGSFAAAFNLPDGILSYFVFPMGMMLIFAALIALCYEWPLLKIKSLSDQAQSTFSSGDYDLAISLLDEALRLMWRTPQAHPNAQVAHARSRMLAARLGDKIYLLRGIANDKRGIDGGPDFDQAVKLSPNCAEAHFHRANHHCAQGKDAEAITDYTHAIRLDPQHARAYYNRGSAYYNSGNPAQARVSWEAARRLDPDVEQDADIIQPREAS